MELKKERSCIVCNKMIDTDPVTINKAILDLFEFLAESIDRNALQNALICAICLETINEAVNFKIAHLEKQKGSSLETIQDTNEKIVLCYICKNPTQSHSVMPLFNSCCENEISYMIPKEDLDNLVNPQICHRCHTFVLNFRSITLFLSTHDFTKTTNDQLKSETEMSEEEFKIDIVDNCLPEDSELNVDMSKELKQEIKEEIEESEENFHRKQTELVWMECEADPSSAGSFIIKDRERSSTLQYPGNLTAYSNDSNWTTSVIKTEIDYKESCILYNMPVHEDTNEVEWFKCQICQFQTKLKANLKQHMLIHKEAKIDEVELFKCQNCHYQTKRKGNLKQHLLVHKGTNDVEPFKCHNCQFHTKHKRSLIRHMRIHKSSNAGEPFICNNCQFQTKHKYHLKKHMLIHNSTNKVELFKCQNCQFQTKHKYSLKKHIMLIHKSTTEVKLFKCQNCQYQTKLKSYLKQHMNIHKDTNEVEMFKCQNCQYQTKRRDNLKQHLLIHKGTDDVKLFKCQNCQFHTKHKRYLKTHMLIHKGTNEVDLFICKNCQFQTKYKYYLKKHMLIHKSTTEVEMFNPFTVGTE